MNIKSSFIFFMLSSIVVSNATYPNAPEVIRQQTFSECLQDCASNLNTVAMFCSRLVVLLSAINTFAETMPSATECYENVKKVYKTHKDGLVSHYTMMVHKHPILVNGSLLMVSATALLGFIYNQQLAKNTQPL